MSERSTILSSVPFVLSLAALFAWSPVPAQSQVPTPSDGSLFEDLTYRHIGPIGNRVSAVVGVPGDPSTYYIGAASGGVFKSTDGGIDWTPIFDDQPVSSIGALALAPSNPDIVWAGTGETFIRSNVSIGNGIYRSTDAGGTWEHMGLDETGRIGRIIVHPDNPDIVYAAAMGHLYGPQEDRGVYRTTDGGVTWERVLFVNEDTGASDLAMNPVNPNELFAGMWPMLIRTWGRWSGGPGGGIWHSTDGGETWERMEGNGLPAPPIGKVGLSMTPADPGRIYALIETNTNRDYVDMHGVGLSEPFEQHEGVLWRSDDGGANWEMVNAAHTLSQRPLYYNRATVAPDNADEIHFLSTAHTRSSDGGRSVRGGGAGGDNHDMWIDPLLPDRMIVGHDGGVSISNNRGSDWYQPRLPIAQMYHVYTDTRVPYFVYGNRQDGSSFMGPSNTLSGGSIPIGSWHPVGGCESGFAVPDTVSNNVVWSGCYEGILDRFTIDNRQSRTVSVWPDNPESWPAGENRYRFQWTFPIHISPHDGERVYTGSQHVHRTVNGGQSWEVISPDLTTSSPEMLLKTGGLTVDDASPTYGAVVFAIAESPLERGVIWAGSNDGLVHVTRDDGATWTDVTSGMEGVPPDGTVSNIEPSRHTPGTAYVTLDLHQVNDTRPFIYRTSDYGASWTLISTGIPESVFSYVHVVREDPTHAGLLYAGTENGLYVSFDDGGSWGSLQSNLPHAPVHWLTIQPHFNDLVVATYGRGFWILDDLTPIQQMAAAATDPELHFFSPRPAYRWVSRAGDFGSGTPAAGRNPTGGASLHYLVGDGADGTGAQIEVVDSNGDVVQTVSGPGTPGLHRVYWNLRYESSESPRMRTVPLEHDHVEVGPNGRGAGDGGRVTPSAVPGTYTLRLSVGDETRTTELTVLKDPTSEGTIADIRAQHEMLLTLRADASTTAALISDIESVRAQMYQRRDATASRADADAIRARIEAADEALIALEMLLTDPRLTGGQDSLRWPRQLFAKITSLGGYVSGSDHRPTDQSVEVHQGYRQLLQEYLTRMDEIRSDELAALNELLREAGLDLIVSNPPTRLIG